MEMACFGYAVALFILSITFGLSGDVVISYAFASVRAVGVARTHCYSCPRPDEFGRVGTAWDKRGWRVDVDFQRLQRPFRTADYCREISPLLPERYSLIKKDGFGN